jgi:hypothetical protein
MLHIKYNIILKVAKYVVGSLFEVKKGKIRRQYSGFDKFIAQPTESIFNFLIFLL